MTSQTLNTFNPIAPYYDRLARLVFGRAIRNSQTIFLDRISARSKLLVIGGGTGWWLKDFLNEHPECTVWYIDASTKMLDRVNRNSSSQIKLIHGTEDDIPPIKFDVVITHFFLDMFEKDDLRSVIDKIKTSLRTNGIWLISDFVSHKFWHKVLLFLMYGFFRIVGAIKTKGLPNWEKELADKEIHCTDRVYFFGRFISSGIYQYPT